MKKMISMVLALVLLTLSMPAFAASEDAEMMQEVLLLVKEKISIPEDLTEFSGDVYRYDEREIYYFEWSDEDYKKSIAVSADAKGRITSYYDRTVEISNKKISEVGKTELISFAEAFLRKTVPEAFVSETDLLIYDEENYFASENLRYDLEFVRKKNGVPVKNNRAHVNLCVFEDKIYVRNMDINFVYDAEFAEDGKELTDYVEKYKELFPTEMVYRNEYQSTAKKNEPRYFTKLIYRIKDYDVGYMDIETGERVVEDSEEETYKNSVMEDGAADSMLGSSGGGMLTPQELAELETVEGLIPRNEIVKTVKALPYIDFDERMTEKRSSLRKNYFGEYQYVIDCAFDAEDEYKAFDITANAKTGEVLSIHNYSGEYYQDAELTEEEVKEAEEKIEEFLNAVAPEKFAQTEDAGAENNKSEVIRRFVRIVNGVKFIDNRISVIFDAENNMVKSYILNFNDGDFANPDDAISAEDAYAKILEFSPVSPIYVMSGGKYKKVVSLEKGSIAIDAVSGMNMNEESNYDFDYSDISGHWAEEAATKLAKIQIGFSGDKLEPDKNITQEELLRLLATGIYGSYYHGTTTDELYDMLIRDKVVLEEEKAPDAEVSREDAFVFIIRMAGLERVAKLSDIYKVTYSDGNLLSDGKIGYAAILSGMGVICGNGGFLRPCDSVTRAEAIMMMYKYLLSI